VAQARLKISDSAQLEPYLRDLWARGFSAEVLLLQAESARARGKPLHELGFLIQLTKKINVSHHTVPLFRHLASLLAQLDEPLLAVRYYKHILPFQKEVEREIERLRNLPLASLEPEKTLRSDISPPKLAVQEMEKDTVLGRPFQWKLLLPSRVRRAFQISSLLELYHWEEALKSNASRFDRPVKTAQEELAVYDGQACRESQFLMISEIGSSCPSPYLLYVLSLDREKGQAEGFGLFDPNTEPQSGDLSLSNAVLANAYRKVTEQREFESWLDQVTGAMRRVEAHAILRRS
jgi:hypothetical protein